MLCPVKQVEPGPGARVHAGLQLLHAARRRLPQLPAQLDAAGEKPDGTVTSNILLHHDISFSCCSWQLQLQLTHHV